jgi:dolichyl-phosphate-mannose--protein O-mannosyl transferase
MLAQLNLDQIQTNAFPSNKIPTSVGSFIGNILPYIFGAAAIALLIYLILGGFQFMTSQGDPKTAQGAQAKITNALIGFIIVIFAYVIVRLLGTVLGLTGTSFGIPFGL